MGGVRTAVGILVTVGLIAFTLTTSAIAPAAAVDRPSDAPRSVVAVGDSFLAGVGAGSYYVADSCRRSTRSATAEWARATSRPLVDLTCPGATAPQARVQLQSLPRNARVVVVSAGGNDIGFANLAGSCLLAGADTCRRAIAEARLRLPRLHDDMRSLVRSVRLTAPSARVVVLGYPRLLGSVRTCRTFLDADRVRRLDSLQRQLDRTLADAATITGARFLDWPRVVDRHSLCSASPWYALPGSRIDDLLHPTQPAHAALASRLLRAVPL
jgi:lysophospholipase L1-like esterase